MKRSSAVNVKVIHHFENDILKQVIISTYVVFWGYDLLSDILCNILDYEIDGLADADI